MTHALSVFVRDDEPLGSWTVGGSRPEESVAAISVVVEAHEEERVLVDGENVPGHLVVVSVEFSNELAAVRTFVVAN